MYTLCGASPRRSSAVQRLPLLVALLLLPVVSTVGMRAASQANPTVVAVRLEAAQARRAGFGVELVKRTDLPAPLLEVRAMASGAQRSPAGPGTLLAATADGSAVAMAEQVGQDPTTLVIADADGSQLRIPVAGLLTAAFAPDGSWLAMADGLGRLWRIDAVDGRSDLLADGPFAGSLLVESSGTILALAVSSVEAPFMSRLVRLDASGGTVAALSDEELVYGMAVLADGSLAVVSHRPTGTTLQRLADGDVLAASDLGSGAVNVSLSSDGTLVAWERDGQVLVRSADRPIRVIGPGSRPRVAPNGSLLLIDDPAGGTSAVSSQGETIAHLDGPVALLECGGCQP